MNTGEYGQILSILLTCLLLKGSVSSLCVCCLAKADVSCFSFPVCESILICAYIHDLAIFFPLSRVLIKTSFTYHCFVNMFSNLQKESWKYWTLEHIHYYMYYFCSQSSRLQYIFHCNFKHVKIHVDWVFKDKACVFNSKQWQSSKMRYKLHFIS